MSVKFANNAHSTLAASISTSATSITVASGQGARFPSLSSGEFFYATLIDTSNNLEIVKVTGRSTDVLTVTRAQESTTARAFSSGDRIELRVTAQSLVDHRIITADEIVNSMIATDAVNADSIAADAVGASELNVSGNGTAGQALLSDGDGTMSWGDGGQVVQVKHLQNTTRGTPTGTGTYLNWGSFTKIKGTDSDLIMHGTIHAHEQYGNNVGNPSIRWNSHAEYIGWVRTFSNTSYQLGFSFIVRFSAKAAGTSDITWYVPNDSHRWQAVINPTNSDSGVASRYSNTIGSTVTIYEVLN